MKSGLAVKIAIYAVLILAAIFCANRFLAKYSLLMDSKASGDAYELRETSKSSPESAPIELPSVADSPSEEQPQETNAEETLTGDQPESALSDPETGTTQEVETANVDAPSPTPSQEPAPITKAQMERRENSPDTSGMAMYAFALFAVILLTGFLAAHDISSIMAVKAHKLISNDDIETFGSAEYDRAEEVWASGDHLEAIRLMREYLNKRPREVHVMIRIAEIYEKDMGNFLAAALEYEELLKHKLQAEQWGWAAIHLVNLYYGKLNKPDKGLELLRRIHREYGHTSAAIKARKRLRDIDPNFAEEEARMEAEEQEADEAEESATGPSPAQTHFEDDSSSNLPKGFRPKN